MTQSQLTIATTTYVLPLDKFLRTQQQQAEHLFQALLHRAFREEL